MPACINPMGLDLDVLQQIVRRVGGVGVDAAQLRDCWG
jgi:hypothetical protein